MSTRQITNAVRITFLSVSFFVCCSVAQSETLEKNCNISGQKFGTNLHCNDGTAYFGIDEDSKDGEILYKTCTTGEDCILRFEANAKNDVTKIHSARPVIAKVNPSFNCAKAKSFAEIAICHSSELAKLDNELAAAFKAALAKSGNKTDLKNEQKDWLTKVRNICQSDACLSQTLKERSKKLGM